MSCGDVISLSQQRQQQQQNVQQQGPWSRTSSMAKDDEEASQPLSSSSSSSEVLLAAVAMEEKLSLKKRGSPSSRTARNRRELLPEHLVCPISRALMADPVVIASGQSYERVCIELWFQRGYRHCFQSGLAIELPPVCIPNLQLGAAIAVWCHEHQVPRPRLPSLRQARELLEKGLSRAAMNSPSPRPSLMWFADEIDAQQQPGFFANGSGSCEIDACQQPGFFVNGSGSCKIDAWQQPGFFVDGSGSSEIFETSGDDSSGLCNNGMRIEYWNDDKHTDLVFVDEERQRWQEHEAAGGVASRRRELNSHHQSGGSSTTGRNPSLPSAFRGFPETPTDDAPPVSQNRDRSCQRQQQQQYRESVAEGNNEASGLYHAARNHHRSQGRERSLYSGGGFAVQTLSRISRGSDKDLRNHQQPWFGLSGRVEDNGDEVPDSRYARSATVGESHTDEVHTSEEFSTNGIPSPLTTKLHFSHSDEGVVLDQDPVMVVEEKILRKMCHKETAEQQKGATELRYLTREVVDYQLTLCTSVILTALLRLLQSKHAGVQSNAAAAIMNLSLPNKNKVMIVDAGTIPRITEVLKTRNAKDAHIHAAGVLFSLATNNEIRATDRFLHAIPPLIDLLKSEPLEAQHDAAMALYHLSSSQINRVKLIQAGGVTILLGVVGEESAVLARIKLLVLHKLAAVPEGRNAICEANGVKELVTFLALRSLPPPLGPVDNAAAVKGLNDWASVREHAAAVLLQLSHQNVQFRTQALQAGAITPLVKLAEHGTDRAKRKAVSLLQKIE